MNDELIKSNISVSQCLVDNNNTLRHERFNQLKLLHRRSHAMVELPTVPGLTAMQ